MKVLKFFSGVRSTLRSFNKEAAIDSMKNVLAVLGLGLLIGDFSTMNPLYVIPAAVLLIAVWYGDYLRHDLPAAPPDTGASEVVIKNEQALMNPIDHLGRAS